MASYTETLERVLRGDWSEASEEDKDEAVRKLLQVCSVAAGAAAIQPIPLLDAALLTPIQIGLVQGIGRIRGYTLDRKSIVEILTSFGASVAAQTVIMAAAKFVPILGWAIGISMAYALTWAIGEVADHYFKHGRGVPAEELQSMFKESYKAKRAEKEAEVKSDGSLKQRLQQLGEAYQAGLMDEETYEAKKAQMISEL